MKLLESAYIIFLILFTLVLPLALVAAVIFSCRRLFGKRSNKKYLKGKTIVPQYEPPAGLTPAETGLLFDQRGGRLEFLATIYNLKTKKVISLAQDSAGRVTMRLLNYQSELLASYEDLLVRYFFHEGKEQVLDSFFDKDDFVAVQSYVQYLVMQSLQAKGFMYIEEGYETQSYATYLNNLIANPLVVFKYFKQAVSNNLTAKAIEMMPLLEGFKQYIETAELDKIKFHAQGSLEEYIELLTPYAIAFNQMERWQVIGIPLFTFKREQINAAQYDQSSLKSENAYDNILKAVNSLDANKVQN